VYNTCILLDCILSLASFIGRRKKHRLAGKGMDRLHRRPGKFYYYYYLITYLLTYILTAIEWWQ